MRQIRDLQTYGHCEADTMIFRYRKWATDVGFKKILIRADDSDVFLGALQHRDTRSETVIDKGLCGKNNRKQINMNDLAETLGDDVSSMIVLI